MTQSLFVREAPLQWPARALSSWALLALALSGCEVPRPDDAYDATYDITAEVTRITDGAITSEASVDAGNSGFENLDGGVDPSGDGGATDPEQARLRKLSGLYFMRIDLYSSPVAMAAGYTVMSPTRVSYLYLVEVGLSAADGKPKSRERLCHQTYFHKCTVKPPVLSAQSCTLSTLVTPASVTPLQTTPILVRDLTVKKGALSFTTGETVVALGYDGSGNDKLPAASNNDSRAWSTSDGKGLSLYADYSGMPKTLKCTVNSAQRFATSFSGTLAGTVDAPSVLDAELALNVSDAESVTFAVSGDPDCSSGSGDPAATTRMNLRFEKLTAGLVAGGVGQPCPLPAAWDNALPAEPPS